ncbi:MAG TPA: CGNR zinc finger domain-containing protein [Ilumatobacteraceae bacterium]
MLDAYRGPVRGEPLAIKLYNTIYVADGVVVDGLAEPTSASAWLATMRERLPLGGAGGEPNQDELTALRDVVRDVLDATVEQRTPSKVGIEALNTASARAPRSAAARWRRGGDPEPIVRFHSDRRADIVISGIAADAIELVTGPARTELRSCGAPGCVLMFLKDHPRREWCSRACGNRARQARHYRRTRARRDSGSG